MYLFREFPTMNWVPVSLLVMMLISCDLYGQADSQTHGSWDVTVYSGISMGRWLYDKGLDDTQEGFHQGYDRTHLAVYVPLHGQIGYSWNKWRIGVGLGTSYLYDDELIASTTKTLVPREYFITDGSPIRFINYGLNVERDLIVKKRYDLAASIVLGSFASRQDHPRKEFFAGHYLIELGINNRMYVSRSWYFLVRPSFKRKYILTKDAAFREESHEIVSFGLDFGLGIHVK